MWIDQRGSEVLPRAECLRLLAVAARSTAIGRLAVSTHGAPIVQPVNFAYDRGQVVVCLGEGFMRDHAPGHLVAFEVDAVTDGEGPDTHVAWSVLVRGLATPLDPVDRASERDAHRRSEVDDSRRLPHPMVAVPGHHVLAIRPDVVSGRRLRVDEAGDSFGVAAGRHAEPEQRPSDSASSSGKTS